MRFFFLALLPLLCTCVRAQGIVIDLTSAGVSIQPVGFCDDGLPDPDCSAADGEQEITVAPGELYGFFFAWENTGAVTFAEVRATDQLGNLLFMPVITPLPPGESANISGFRAAPEIPGFYDFLVTVTASEENDREDTQQFRYFVTVDQSLPVQLMSFIATSTAKKQVDLYWQTSEEVNNMGFAVEHSTNGRTFTQLSFSASLAGGGAAGAGEVEEANRYHFRDTSAPAGRNFYRLRQVDTDGTETLSKVVTVAVAGAAGVYPNPADETIRLTGFSDGPAVVYDGSGRVVMKLHLPESRGFDVSNLGPGMYWLRTHNELIRFVKR